MRCLMILSRAGAIVQNQRSRAERRKARTYLGATLRGERLQSARPRSAIIQPLALLLAQRCEFVPVSETGENGGEKLVHGSGGMELLRAA